MTSPIAPARGARARSPPRRSDGRASSSRAGSRRGGRAAAARPLGEIDELLQPRDLRVEARAARLQRVLDPQRRAGLERREPQAAGAHRRAREREHDVHPDRAQVGALPGHVRSGDEEHAGSVPPEPHVVRHGAGARSGWRSASPSRIARAPGPVQDLRPGVLRVLVGVAGERGERLELGDRVEPARGRHLRPRARQRSTAAAWSGVHASANANGAKNWFRPHSTRATTRDERGDPRRRGRARPPRSARLERREPGVLERLRLEPLEQEREHPQLRSRALDAAEHARPCGRAACARTPPLARRTTTSGTGPSPALQAQMAPTASAASASPAGSTAPGDSGGPRPRRRAPRVDPARTSSPSTARSSRRSRRGASAATARWRARASAAGRGRGATRRAAPRRGACARRRRARTANPRPKRSRSSAYGCAGSANASPGVPAPANRPPMRASARSWNATARRRARARLRARGRAADRERHERREGREKPEAGQPMLRRGEPRDRGAPGEQRASRPQAMRASARSSRATSARRASRRREISSRGSARRGRVGSGAPARLRGRRTADAPTRPGAERSGTRRLRLGREERPGSGALPRPPCVESFGRGGPRSVRRAVSDGGGESGGAPSGTRGGARCALLAVRRRTLALAAPLSPEDALVQSMPDASPAKWHLAHTTWFFETFVLARGRAGRSAVPPGVRVPLQLVLRGGRRAAAAAAARAALAPAARRGAPLPRDVDERMGAALAATPPTRAARRRRARPRHEQQHQELLLTDVKHAFSRSPLRPRTRRRPRRRRGAAAAPPLALDRARGRRPRDRRHAGRASRSTTSGRATACSSSPTRSRRGR